ncbi:MAG: rod shape-determining protein MreC [Dysgonomonas sp.]
MRNLITFLIKNSYWFLFIALEIVCFFFIFNYNLYQKSIFFNASNEAIGRVYSVSGSITSFFNLRKNNETLLLENEKLQQRVLSLENYIYTSKTDTLQTGAFVHDSLLINTYNYTVARVINNSIAQVDNYIIINKGRKDSIETEMGVVSTNGIVGFVRAVSSNYSLVQSILNPKTQLSCKVKGSNIPTTLIWDAGDYRYADLKDFPRFEKFEKGDTIITSGVSNFFPEGFIVGTIEDFKSQKDDNFLTLKVKLATDFATLNDVLIINNYAQKEITQLRKEVGYE